MNYTGYGRPTSTPSVYLKFVIAAVAMIQVLSVSAADAAKVVRGPYLQTVTPTSIIVKWRTDVASDAQVKFGPSSADLSQSAYSSNNGTDHEVALTGLTPSTRYYYAVGSSSETFAGDQSFRFVTAPAADSQESTRVWVLGDPGTENHGSPEVRDGYKKLTGSASTNLILMLGDNAYEDGKDGEYQDAIFDIYPELLRQTPVYSTFGNHDGHTARSSDESGAYYDIFSFPRNAEAGGVATGTEAYFSFDYGNVHYISLNSTDVDDDVNGPMMLWLESDLAATDKDFIVAFWHHPPYSKGSHSSDDSASQTAMRENALPLLEQYGADLILSGHSHGYERSFLIDGHYGYSSTFDNSMILDGGSGREDGTGVYSKNPNVANQGTAYLVMGVSGRVSSDGSFDHPAMLVNKRELGSVVLDISGSRMDVSFIGTEGETFDQFTISKGSDLTPPAIVGAAAQASTSVHLEFSEALSASSAESLRNYTISRTGELGPVADVEVLSASLSADGRTVLLGTTPLEKEVVYKLAVQNIADRDDNVTAATVEILVADVEPPTNIATVMPAAHGIWIDWVPPLSGDIVGYHVWRDGSDMGVVAEPEYKAMELELDTDYTFAVASVDSVGNESVKVFFHESTLSQQSFADDDTGWEESAITNELLAATNAALSFTVSAAVAAPSEKGQSNGNKSWKKSGDQEEQFAATAVQNIQTLGKSSDSIWIGWDEPTETAGVAGYKVRLNKTDKGVVSNLEYKATGLQPSTSYRFEISPVDSSGTSVARARYTETTLTVADSGTEPTEPTAPTEPLPPSEPNTVPTISGSPAGSVQVGTRYSFQPVASDADGGPAKLSFSISNKPDWAAFAGDTGELSGTPSAAGTTENVRISVSDGEASASLPAFDLTVKAAATVSEGSEGDVKFFVDAKSNFDAWTKSPTTEDKAWMRENYYRMQTYSPYFDNRLNWYQNAWVYKDAYALKPGWSITSQHPEWVLRDAGGNMLYIPYACSGSTCSQYAADIGNSEFRNWWLNTLADSMSAGYIGVWVDDVNLKWRVGNGDTKFINPIDPRTGAEMTYANYQRYFAEFMEAIRSRFPKAEIAHNAIWSTEAANGDDRYLRRQVLAADYINLERGVTDSGIKGGTGRYGFETFLNYIDWVHRLGRNVIMDDDDDSSDKDRDYELAVYFLINNGGDLIGADGDRERMNPDNFWSGYLTNIGDALGARYKADGLFRRDFTCGVVLVNQPGEPARTVHLGEVMKDLNGNSVDSVTLGESEGEVLVRACN